MKGKYGGPMTVDDLYQALYQDRDFFRRKGITHVRGVYLYFTPCDEYGEAVTIADQSGNRLDGYVSAGAYVSSADVYEARCIEPKPITRPRFLP